MSTPAKIIGFTLGLVALFVAMIGVGRAVGPVAESPDDHDGDGHGAVSSEHEGGNDEGHGGHTGGSTPAAAEMPGGLQTSESGYTLTLDQPSRAAGRQRPVSFVITGPEGQPVTEFDTVHDKQLHLIAVRRDQSGFQHVHPRMDSSGRWRTRLDLTSGTWRLFADFTATGADPLTLGVDLQVPGDYRPAAPAVPRRTAEVDDYRVTLDGDLAAGTEATLTLRVSRRGQPVTDLQPYLGAYGHLVALREGDLAYLHVHPDGEPGTVEAGPEIVFHTEVPSAGRYRLHLDFRHRGTVRSASFVVVAGAGGPMSDNTPDTSPEGGHDDESDSHDH